MDNKKYKMTHEECGCTKQEFIESLVYLPSESIKEIFEKGYVEATCENCGTEYNVDIKEIEKVLDTKLGEGYGEFGNSLCDICNISDNCIDPKKFDNKEK